jgi:excisionase family DNA binding protein
MSEITIDEKIDLLKKEFPNQSYSIQEIAKYLRCSKDTVMDRIKKYEVPMIRITGSPIIRQANLINFMIRAIDDHFDEANHIGLEFCIIDQKKRLVNNRKQG